MYIKKLAIAVCLLGLITSINKNIYAQTDSSNTIQNPNSKTDQNTDPNKTPIRDTVVIKAETLEPQINRQDETLYKEGFPARDDQVLFQFGSGINAGQHEGGGKSLEI